MTDSEPLLSPPGTPSRLPRRTLLAAASTALAACATAPKTGLDEPAPPRAALPEVPAPALPPAPPPAPVAVAPPAPPPAPLPSVLDLGMESIVQPFWSGDGSRILYYDQPGPGQGGTWAVEPGGAPARERPQWGYYVSRGGLLVTPRPDKRDTYVLHLGSGREWALPTTNSTLFSADGTVVAYTPSTPQTPNGGGFNFSTTTIVVAGADDQNARRIPLPIQASFVSWIPGQDGSPNGRILLTGKRSRQDGTAFFVFDVPNRTLVGDFGRTRRLSGPLPSPDGTWVAYMAMWNQDQAQNGLWIARSNGSSQRRIDLVGSYRWASDSRLLVIPTRASGAGSHEVWDVNPGTGDLRRLTDPAQTPFRLSNYDWDLSPDGTSVVFVSADTRRLSMLSLPDGIRPIPGSPPPGIPVPAVGGGAPYRLPFETPPSPSTWFVAQWYGVTTAGYRGRNSVYREGQGIHFGVDLTTLVGTPVVAVAPGRVIAIDGDYGSPPHNVVIQLADGNQAMYGHLIEPSRHVRVGQTVEAGQVVGNTGDSASPYDGYGNPHIHLEIRKRGRDTATNPVLMFDYNWDDLSLGVYPGPRFERNLDDPHRFQFPDDQPDIRFGGAIITNFTRPWPP